MSNSVTSSFLFSKVKTPHSAKPNQAWLGNRLESLGFNGVSVFLSNYKCNLQNENENRNETGDDTFVGVLRAPRAGSLLSFLFSCSFQFMLNLNLNGTA